MEIGEWVWFYALFETERYEWQTKQKEKEPAVEHWKSYHFFFLQNNNK